MKSILSATFTTLATLATFGLTAALAVPAVVHASETAPAQWNTGGGAAVLGGYDVVSYFTEDRAVRGQSDLSANFEGGTFYFSSQENLEAFRKAPAKYAPAFGGYCAFGVAQSKTKAPADPRTFKIYNGRLLVFFNDLYQGQPVNTKVLWNGNEQSFYAAAAKTWPTLE